MQENLKSFFKAKSLGFYFTVAAVVLSLIQVIIYAIAFTTVLELEVFFKPIVFVLPIIGIVGAVALSLFKPTAGFAPMLVTLMTFMGFLMFISNTYIYFSTAFFGGVTIGAILNMEFGVLYSLILYILTCVIGIAAIFLKQDKSEVA